MYKLKYLLTSISLLTLSLNVNALDAGAESVEDYSGCGCSSGNLNYCNDQASKFISEIDKYHDRIFWFANGTAWNADMTEQDKGIGGYDDTYGDNVHILLVSGHGSYDATLKRYDGYLCKNSTYNSCSFNTSNTYLGEISGQTYSTNTGKLRFLILCTCHSINKDHTVDEWGSVFWRGKDLMYIMGYHGTSEDSENTDEVGKEFADNACADGWTLKKSWFRAAYEAFSGDVPAVVTHGKDAADATNRLDNMKIDWTPSGNNPYHMAWSWDD